jgi:hypothetical protein
LRVLAAPGIGQVLKDELTSPKRLSNSRTSGKFASEVTCERWKSTFGEEEEEK